MRPIREAGAGSGRTQDRGRRAPEQAPSPDEARDERDEQREQQDTSDDTTRSDQRVHPHLASCSPQMIPEESPRATSWPRQSNAVGPQYSIRLRSNYWDPSTGPIAD